MFHISSFSCFFFGQFDALITYFSNLGYSILCIHPYSMDQYSLDWLLKDIFISIDFFSNIDVVDESEILFLRLCVSHMYVVYIPCIF